MTTRTHTERTHSDFREWLADYGIIVTQEQADKVELAHLDIHKKIVERTIDATLKAIEQWLIIQGHNKLASAVKTAEILVMPASKGVDLGVEIEVSKLDPLSPTQPRPKDTKFNVQ